MLGTKRRLIFEMDGDQQCHSLALTEKRRTRKPRRCDCSDLDVGVLIFARDENKSHPSARRERSECWKIIF